MQTKERRDSDRKGRRDKENEESAWKVIKKEEERYNLIELEHAIHSSEGHQIEHTK